MQKICSKTGQPFELPEAEIQLRKKMKIAGEPDTSPIYRFMHLGAFWQHWHLYSRKCDKTGQDMISVYSQDCPYPVWYREEWLKSANPPGIDFDPKKKGFEQLWELFQKSPIAHNMVGGNENCEYTDDWWYSKNCYLCHSGLNCEDVKYSYRALACKDSQWLVFSSYCELCFDLTYCFNCFNLVYSFNCRQCTDSAFLYDCRNCQNCMFCSNLRNKQYCFGNQQMTKEAYEQKKQEWNLASRKIYEKATGVFNTMLKRQAWYRALMLDKCENSYGDFLDGCKNCYNCYLITSPAEDCINCTRQGGNCRDTLDCISATINTELTYCCSLAQDQCYDNKFCYNTIQCRFAEYCAHCFQCEHCFGCCGLVGKKYHIFNKPYTPEEYERVKQNIIAHMQQTREYGQFFPGYFAAHPYVESWSYMYWPLTEEEQKRYGFRLRVKTEQRVSHYEDMQAIPDNSHEADEKLAGKVFWDNRSQKPFQIQKADIAFAQSRNIPLPYMHYARRLQEHFKCIPVEYQLRTIVCGKCGVKAQTSWPSNYDGRILCEQCYLKEVH